MKPLGTHWLWSVPATNNNISILLLLAVIAICMVYIAFVLYSLSTRLSSVQAMGQSIAALEAQIQTLTALLQQQQQSMQQQHRMENADVAYTGTNTAAAAEAAVCLSDPSNAAFCNR